MQITKINTLNFNGLFIDRDISLPLLAQSDCYMHTRLDYKILFDKMDKCRNAKYADVFVTKNGKVYVKDKKNKKRVFSATDKPLFYQYYLALTKALVMEEYYQNGEDPYNICNDL